MRGLFPVTGEDVVAGFVLRSPFFFGLDSVLGELTDGRPLGREGGPALDVTGKIVPRADTPLGRDPGSNGSNAMAVAPGRSTAGATRLVSNSPPPWTGGVARYDLVVPSGEGWGFAGANLHDSPYPFTGHNTTIVWTHTENQPDQIH